MENLPEFLKGKRLALIVGALIVLLIVLMVFSTRSNNQSQSVVQPTQAVQPAPDENTDIFNDSQNAQSPEVQQAISEQIQADQEYADWQQSNSDAYSWIRKLPLTAVNYFVYFDLEKKVFIGRLYPKTGENVDQLKSEVLNRLKTEKEIPVENFQFEWMVNP
ncbi:hypothetical protein A2954_06465 [Candidatus Roizmanbacteria bacterium RIFCSPLOWO2_01_FULL_37_12]|uniref:Uncharacterized protein n=1 Tax=Candidatus Roizmanbacteria bacterium RIFCSPLOWO2_01_FULL_37_12 TaxID=1802056 RepID=A0A1F7I9Z1_9BACT|nr:MAG: hypothetical protein A2768_00660 [Candidatus Roizmanbacteria bacterium RIFCSPHIGHO2_01_FULL_37_16]OGK26827.1 MAG: hypothetical protein A3D76_05075 [Candidatus Roizmanbacteria bacterium RIFCSPHIGHO2_02_FULL_37_9b]OGK40152.1 MAG: hypothetical protein A2954_06465 [Candidatus Roizmanbacteria bacterium RIFCSPLOWO2_01_FULL_37_12]